MLSALTAGMTSKCKTGLSVGGRSYDESEVIVSLELPNLV